MEFNRFGVILEDIRDKFDFLAEGIKILDNRMDKLENRMDKLENTVDYIKIDMGIVKTFMGKIEDGLNNHEKRITGIERILYVKE